MIIRVEVHDDFVRVIEADRTADFHLRWLRHNCDVDRHPLTGERAVDSAELPDQLAVVSARVDGEHLQVQWQHDGRVSRYARRWLLEHAYAVDRPLVPPPPSDIRRIELAARGHAPSELAREALHRVASEGAVVIRRDRDRAPAPELETEAWIAAFSAERLALIETH